MVLVFVLAGSAAAIGAANNVALHKKATVSPRSNYSYTKDRDPAQLTDGIYASTQGKWNLDSRVTHLWTKKGCLTWVKRKPVIITIDLGSVQPISGLIYSTAGGIAGVTWPTAIYVAVSNDGKTWHYAGDLVALSTSTGHRPPNKGYANFRYITQDLKTHGRYIKLGINQRKFVVCDEVEVLRGPDALLQQSAGAVIPPMKEFSERKTITKKAQRRQNADIASVRKLLHKATLLAVKNPGMKKSAWATRLAIDAAATRSLSLLPVDFKTIIPLTDVHRDILAIHGELLAARGFSPLTLWKVHRYAYRPLVEIPTHEYAAQISLSMLKNAIRSDSLLLTNATGEPKTVHIRLENPPAGAQDGWLKLTHAIWTDTLRGTPVQDALMPMKKQNGAYTMTIPAGLTGKLWITVDASKVPSGDYTSAIVITSGSQHLTAPMKLHVSNLVMHKPRMSMFVWDYTNRDKMYGLTKANRRAAIKLMQSHFVDSPWAVWVFPRIEKGDFNAQNELTGKLNFSSLDQWVSMWPDARNYFVFWNISNKKSFAGKKMGTTAFNARLGSWMKTLVAHWKTLGLEPSQLVLCLVDEPNTNVEDHHMILWGSAIKAATSKVRIYSDPIWHDPTESKYFPKSLLIPDILSPHPGWSTPLYQSFHRRYGKTLCLYNGPGLHHTGDPQLAYRQMAWRVFAIGGKGEGFWAFGDTAGAKTSWNAYTASGPIYAPAYIDKNTVYDSIHWDAAREGVEDFEVLSMLQDAIKKCSDITLRKTAKRVLDNAVKSVNSDVINNPSYKWAKGTNPFVVDKQLSRVRKMLVELNKQ